MKEFDLIIKNGTVVTSTESFLCDVAVNRENYYMRLQ